jgi:hypothetical protein
MLRFFKLILPEPRLQYEAFLICEVLTQWMAKLCINRIFLRPIRDEIWVEKTNHPLPHRAVGWIRALWLFLPICCPYGSILIIEIDGL